MPDNASPAVATRDNSPVGQLQAQLQSRALDIKMALPAHIPPDKFQRTVLTAAAQNPDLLTADRQSLILACYKAAQDGLLPDGREAALVVFSTSKKIDGQFKKLKLVQYMPMVYGLRKKILQSGDVVALEVAVVYKIEQENGYFRYEVGTEPPLNYAPMLDIPDEEATDDKIIAAFSIATMRDGTKSYEVMRRSEINKVRQASQTGATGQTVKYGADKGKPIAPKGPWVDWFGEMAKKTVMRRHAKTLPMSGDVLLDIEERGLDPARSAAWALSVEADAPSLITDESGATIDAETGEVVEESVTTDDTSAERVDETAETEHEQGDQPPELTPAEKSAANAIKLFDTAENIVDLQTRYKEVEPHLTFMGAELADSVERSFDENRTRLGGKKPAEKAKADAEAEPAK